MPLLLEKLHRKCREKPPEKPNLVQHIAFPTVSFVIAYAAAQYFRDSLDDAAVESTAAYMPTSLLNTPAPE